MNYFIINNSLDENIMGKLPQLKEVLHNCDVNNEPCFIDKFPFKIIKKEPIISNAVLYVKAKQTDLIEVGSIGFSFGSMVISDDLKRLLDQFNCFGVQFFKTHIIHNNKKIDNYWQTHIYDIPYNYIDFNNTDLLLKDRNENRKLIKKYLERKSKEEFLNIAESLKYPKIVFLKNISFSKEMNLDYFFIRNFEDVGYGLVSERLKDEIEKQNFSGIEFRPINISLNDWLGSNGLRKNIYGNLPQNGVDESISS